MVSYLARHHPWALHRRRHNPNPNGIPSLTCFSHLPGLRIGVPWLLSAVLSILFSLFGQTLPFGKGLSPTPPPAPQYNSSRSQILYWSESVLWFGVTYSFLIATACGFNYAYKLNISGKPSSEVHERLALTMDSLQGMDGISLIWDWV